MNRESDTQSGPRTDPSIVSRRHHPAESDAALVGEEPAVDELLPSLEPGLTLLETDGERVVGPLQALVVDHLLTRSGPAFWVDSRGHAATTSLARVAPSRRLLERIRVARAFTAPQHFAITWDLRERINREIRRALEGGTDRCSRKRRPGAGSEEPADCARNDDARTDGSARTDGTRNQHAPALVVAPAFDAFYRGADAFRTERAAELQARALERLVAYARGYDVPVVVTRTAADEFAAPIETAADRTIRCEQTRLGPRFVGEEFETLVYPVDGGRALQTTIAYWQELLATRARQAGLEPSPISLAETTLEAADPLGDELRNASVEGI